MGKSIVDRLNALLGRVKAHEGEVIVMMRDNDDAVGVVACLAKSPETATQMFYDLFDKFPFLIPNALEAASISLRMNEDEDDDSDNDDDDDGPDDDPDNDGDGLTVDVYGRGCAVCMN